MVLGVFAGAAAVTAAADGGLERQPVVHLSTAPHGAAAPVVHVINRERSSDRLHPRIGRAAGVTDATVGDADSFGRAVKYLGNGQTTDFQLQTSCEGVDPTQSTCVTLPPQPLETDFDAGNLAFVDLPARSAHSLLCFTLTPFLFFEFSNLTGLPQSGALMQVVAVIAIHDAVLDNPALINPDTGIPFYGQIEVSLPTYNESRTLAVGEVSDKDMSLSRSCVGGLISRDALMSTYGLTAAQAKEFFEKPISLNFGVRGSVAVVDSLDISYGFRVYGD
jgi:hypothetical protein